MTLNISSSSYVRDNPMPEDDTAPLLPHPSEAMDVSSGVGSSVADCKPDEFALLVREMRECGIVGVRKTNRVSCCGGKSVKDSFLGKDFVEWCVDKKLMTRDRAIFLGRQLVSRRFAVDVEKEAEFQVRDILNKE